MDVFRLVCVIIACTYVCDLLVHTDVVKDMFFFEDISKLYL
jgi:hypothetical protein